MLPGLAAGAGVEAAWVGPAATPAATSPATAQRARRAGVDLQARHTG
jgi:hypothetical protein